MAALTQALAICNGCDAAVARETSPAGYCADCEADARAWREGEPTEPEPTCPEWCEHDEGTPCAEARAGIHRMEAQAEGAWLRVAEAGYPGYDFDPNDPRSMDR